MNVSDKFGVRIDSPFSEVIAIGVLGGDCEPQCWEEEPYGGRDGKSIGMFL